MNKKKLLVREIAYQIVEKGITENFKDAKKQLWPTFPVHCGIYSLHDYKHAQHEAHKTKSLNLAVIPKRQYDSNKVDFNSTQVKINFFFHEDDEFHDLFTSAETFKQVSHLVKVNLELEKTDQFIQ